MSVTGTVNFYLPCDSDSVLKSIGPVSGAANPSEACHAVYVLDPEGSYTALLNPKKWKHGWGSSSESIPYSINLTNYTKIYTFNNGNFSIVKLFNGEKFMTWLF